MSQPKFKKGQRVQMVFDGVEFQGTITSILISSVISYGVLVDGYGSTPFYFNEKVLMEV